MEKDKLIDGQEILYYACKCGFKDPSKKMFDSHLLSASKKDGKGVHASVGRINIQTGEVVMPPFNQRTAEQKKASIYAMNKKGTDGGSVRVTEVVHDATQVKFVPRVLVCSFTPIMLSGLSAAQRVWGWREDMPFENFLDTVLVEFFRDRGIELASFVIMNPEEHAAIQAANRQLNIKEEPNNGS